GRHRGPGEHRPRNERDPRALAPATLSGAGLRPAPRDAARRGCRETLSRLPPLAALPGASRRVERRSGRADAGCRRRRESQPTRTRAGATEPFGRSPLGRRLERPPASPAPRQREPHPAGVRGVRPRGDVPGRAVLGLRHSLAPAAPVPRRGGPPRALLAGALGPGGSPPGTARAGSPPSPRAGGDRRPRPGVPRPPEERAAEAVSPLGRSRPARVLPTAPQDGLPPALPLRRGGPGPARQPCGRQCGQGVLRRVLLDGALA